MAKKTRQTSSYLKPLGFILVVIFLILQCKIWFSHEGLVRTWQLKRAVSAEEDKNAALKERHKTLQADISVLKTAGSAVEDHARNDLGMIKKGEVFYQVVK